MVDAPPTLAGELVDWALGLELADVPDDVLSLLSLRFLDAIGITRRIALG